MKSASSEDTELELASLDDEPTRSRGPTGGGTADSDRGKTVKATGGNGKDKDRQPGTKDSVAPGAQKSQTKQAKGESSGKLPALGGTQPADATDEAALPTIKADLSSVNLPFVEALVTDALSAEPLPAAGQGPLPDVVLPKPKAQPQSQGASAVVLALGRSGRGGAARFVVASSPPVRFSVDGAGRRPVPCRGAAIVAFSRTSEEAPGSDAAGVS